MNSHFDSIAENELKNSGISLTSFDRSAISDIRRRLDANSDGKFTPEQAVDEFVKYIEKRNRAWYDKLGEGDAGKFKRLMLKKMNR